MVNETFLPPAWRSGKQLTNSKYETFRLGTAFAEQLV
jgi:hypothetical protein